MKPILAAFLVALSPLARGEIVLRGVAKEGDAYLFTLRDTETKTSSPWLGVGGEFAGHVVVSYSPKNASLLLRSKTGESRAHLDAHAVKEQPKPAPIDVAALTDEELVGHGLYRVVAGDTVAKIARVVGLTIPEVVTLNPGLNAAKLRVGQILVIGPKPTTPEDAAIPPPSPPPAQAPVGD